MTFIESLSIKATRRWTFKIWVKRNFFKRLNKSFSVFSVFKELLKVNNGQKQCSKWQAYYSKLSASFIWILKISLFPDYQTNRCTFFLEKAQIAIYWTWNIQSGNTIKEGSISQLTWPKIHSTCCFIGAETRSAVFRIQLVRIAKLPISQPPHRQNRPLWTTACKKSALSGSLYLQKVNQDQNENRQFRMFHIDLVSL